jgi:predicted DNA-binding WGR domain protein
MITLFRIDTQGDAYYYSLHDRQGHLFSTYTFTAAWGKNLSLAREKVYTFETQRDMDLKIKKLLQDKLTHGYRVLYSYLRPEERKDFRPLLKKYAVM